MNGRVRVAVPISGRGSNLASLIEAARAPDYPARIVVVIANRPDAAGLDHARRAEIPAIVLDEKTHADRASYDTALDALLRRYDIELVALAGFMRVLSRGFVEAWHGRLINIHPSLLPAFRGLDTHRRALEAGVSEHGCTVHHVVPALDSGPIIAQAIVPVLPGDDEARLAARVLAQEHLLYPRALARVARDVAAARIRPGA